MHQTDFLAWLEGMLEKIDTKYLEPIKDEPIRLDEGESVVGTISDGNYRLFALYKEFNSKSRKLAVEMLSKLFADKEPDQAAFKTMDDLLAELTIKENVIKNLFWAAARHEFGIYDSSIAMRDGNVIVRIQDKNTAIGSFLEKLGELI